jgi:propanol-preferring alcohol dehydrogenase
MENYCQQPGGPAAGGLGRRDGGMAEFLLVPAARYLISLGSLGPRDAAPLSDAALTSYHAINRSRQLLAPGSTAVVIGAGGLGQMAIQILRALSATTTIVAVHTGPDKLQTARQMGADEALVSGDEAIQRINDITRGKAPSWCSTWWAWTGRCKWLPKSRACSATLRSSASVAAPSSQLQ